MFDTLKQFIDQHLSNTNNHIKKDKHTVNLTTATLMFEVVKADYDIADIELKSMTDILIEQLKLSSDEVINLMKLAQEKSDKAVSLQSFTRVICDNFNNTERCALIENLWVIAYADGKIESHERHVIRKIAGLLYLNDKQIIQAKELAKQRLLSN